jgi:hypothetical protein
VKRLNLREVMSPCRRLFARRVSSIEVSWEITDGGVDEDQQMGVWIEVL